MEPSFYGKPVVLEAGAASTVLGFFARAVGERMAATLNDSLRT